MPTTRINTFHARRGRLGPELNQALSDLMPRYGVAVEGPLDPGELFDPPRPVVLEIGFGMGDATVSMASSDPATGIVAADVHTRGVAALLRAVDELQLENLRIAHTDAVALLERLASGSLAGVRAWFPDPWPKARHHKRRLVQPAAVSLIASRLAQGAELHLTTDWPDYADQMLEVIAGEPLLVNEHSGFAPRPAWRPITRYERAGLDAGRPVVDVIARRA